MTGRRLAPFCAYVCTYLYMGLGLEWSTAAILPLGEWMSVQMNAATFAFDWNGYWILKARSYRCPSRNRICFVPSSALLHSEPMYCHVLQLQGASLVILEVHFSLWRICVQFSQDQWSVILSLFIPKAHVQKNDPTLSLFPCSSLSRDRCVSHLWHIT